MINKRCLVIRGNEWQLGYMMATLERIFKIDYYIGELKD